MDDIEIIVNCLSGMGILSFLISIIFLSLVFILSGIIRLALSNKQTCNDNLQLYLQSRFSKKNTIKVFSIVFFSYLIAFHLFAFHFGIYFFSTGYMMIILIFASVILVEEILILLPGQQRQAFTNFNLLIFSLMVIFLLIEFSLQISGKYDSLLEKRNKIIYTSFFRSQDRDWYHVLVPNSRINIRNVEYCYSRTTNSLGLSDVEPQVSKSPWEFRIIGLGDSFTEGDGTPADSTWLKEVERNLRSHGSIVNYSFINAGIRGSDPFYEYILLKNKLLKYRPDLVIITMNSDDINDIIIRGGMERFTKSGTVKFRHSPGWLWFFESCHIARLIIYNLLRYNYLLLRPAEMPAEVSNATELLNQIILKFNTLSKENKFQLLVVFHPYKSEICYGHFNYIEPLIKDLEQPCYEMHILNMLHYYSSDEHINSKNYNKYFWKIDGHHNSLGYLAFGRGVVKKLREMKITGK